MSPTQKRDKGEEKLFNKIVGENIPHLQKEIDIQTQEAQKVPNKTNTKISVSRYIPIIIKMTKIKDKEIILKAKRSKTTSHIQQNPHQTIRFLFFFFFLFFQQMLCRPEGSGMICLKYLKEKNTTQNSLPDKINTFIIEGERKCPSNQNSTELS